MKSFKCRSIPLLSLLLSATYSLGQSSYLTDLGTPTYSTPANLAVGNVDVSNGNVHIVVPFSSMPQRGKLSSDAHYDYDSKIWQIVEINGSYSWQPVNVPQRSMNGSPVTGGWRWQLGDATGTVQYTAEQVPCYTNFQNFTFTDRNGTAHVFPFATAKPFPSCGSDTSYPTNTGFALDESGYQAIVTNYVSLEVFDPEGNEVYPTTLDTNSNSMSFDPTSGDVHGTAGGLVAIFSPMNGSTQQVDTPSPASIAGANTITYTTISVHTAFGQEDVAEFNGTITVPSNILYPDGTQYQLSYDSGTTAGHYGELTSVVVPTQGTITYTYTNYLDSYGNVNRWLNTVTARGGTTTYTPSVLTQCTSNGSSSDTGCQEQDVMTSPDGNDTVYVMTLSNGAWNTDIKKYSGTHTSGTLLVDSATQNTFSSYATMPGCTTVGAQGQEPCRSIWRTKGITTTKLEDTGQIAVQETDLNQNYPWYGKTFRSISTDFYTGSTVPAPLRTIEDGYQTINAASPFQPLYLSVSYVENGSGTVDSSSYFQYDDQNIYPSPAFPTVATTGTHSGNLTAISNSSGLESRMKYDSGGALLSIQSPLSSANTTTLSYDSSDTLITQITRPSTSGVTHTTTFAYNSVTNALQSANNENSVANGSAYPITYSYYPETSGFASEKLQSINYPDGGIVSFSYPSPTRIDSTTTQNAQSSSSITKTIGLDPYGSLQYQAVGSSLIFYTLDSSGRIQCVTNPYIAGTASTTDGSDCVIQRDGLGRTLAIQHSDGTAIRYTYLGNKITVTKEDGTPKAAYIYDVLGRLTQVWEPDASGALSWETLYTYNSAGQMTSAQQFGNPSSNSVQTRTWSYDSSGNLAIEQTPEKGSTCYGTWSGSSCQTNYDPNGNALQKTDGNGANSYTYDALNRLISDNTTASQSTVTQSFTYDSAPAGAGFNAINAVDQLVASFDSSGGGKYFPQYDSMGRVQQQATCFPNTPCTGTSNLISISYDLAGNALSLTYPDQRTITSSYDTNNRLTTLQYSAWAGQSLASPVNYWSNASYLPGGQVQSAQLGSDISLSAGYSSRELLLNLQYGVSGNEVWGKSYSWSSTARNLLSTTDLMTGVIREFSYDQVDRIVAAADYSTAPGYSAGKIQVKGSDKSTTQCNYAVSSQSSVASSKASPDAAAPPTKPPTCTKVWDSGTVQVTVGPLKVLVPYGQYSSSTSISNQIVSGFSTSGSPVSAVFDGTYVTFTSQQFGASGDYSVVTSVSGSGNDFTVTPINQNLTGGDGTLTSGGMNIAYSIDPFGNSSSTLTPLTFNSQNQISDANHQYTAAGALRTDSNHSFTYDSMGRTIQGEYLGSIATYQYDGDNDRISKIDGAGQTNYVTFAGVRLAVQSGNTWTDFVYSNGGMIAEVSGNAAAAPSYRLNNHLASVAMLTDANGSSLGSNDYFPYGTSFQQTLTDNYQFTGLERNSDDETTVAEHRDYLDFEDRWKNPDPFNGSYDWMDPQSLNRYSYLADRPLNDTDTSGLSSDDNGGNGNLPIIGIIVEIGEDLYAIFGGGSAQPTFHGSTRPRPDPDGDGSTNTGSTSAQNPWNEHLGLPSWLHQSPQGLLGLLSLPSQGCEFGACGGGPSSFQAGAVALPAAGGVAICAAAEPCGAIALTIGATIGAIYLGDLAIDKISDMSKSRTGTIPAERVAACTARHSAEVAACGAKYGRSPRYGACVNRAQWRWSNCLKGVPDPGPAL